MSRIYGYYYLIEVLLSFTEGEESVNNDTLPESAFSPRFVDSIKLINFLQKAGQVIRVNHCLQFYFYRNCFGHVFIK